MTSDFVQRYLDQALLQYQDKPKTMGALQAILEPMGELAKTFDDLKKITDIDQTEGVNLDVIGRLVGQSRDIAVAIENVFFGFEDTPNALGFGDDEEPGWGGIWYEEGQSTTEKTRLSDPLYRILLKLKIFKNHWDGTIGDFEELMQSIFPEVAYGLEEPEPFHVMLTFTAYSQNEKSLFASGFLPQTAGVRYTIVFA